MNKNNPIQFASMGEARKVSAGLKDKLSRVSTLASDRLDLLDRIRGIANSRCLWDSTKVMAIRRILKGY